MNNSYLRVLMALSLAGMILVPVFGLLIRFQPDFVHGLHVRSSSAEVNCYLAGGLYALVSLVCGLLQALKTRDGEPEPAATDATNRNQRYRLPFEELESKEFVRAMETMDRRTAEFPTHKKELLELPTKFLAKAAPV